MKKSVEIITLSVFRRFRSVRPRLPARLPSCVAVKTPTSRLPAGRRIPAFTWRARNSACAFASAFATRRASSAGSIGRGVLGNVRDSEEGTNDCSCCCRWRSEVSRNITSCVPLMMSVATMSVPMNTKVFHVAVVCMGLQEKGASIAAGRKQKRPVDSGEWDIMAGIFFPDTPLLP